MSLAGSRCDDVHRHPDRRRASIREPRDALVNDVDLEHVLPRAIGRPDLVARQLAEGPEAAAVRAEVETIILGKTLGEWERVFAHVDACVVPVLSVGEALRHTQHESRRMLRAMRELAASKGLRGVFAAVRPSSKARHPWVGIDDYITWTDGRGRAFDPWLRSHLSSGGKLVGPCKRSMVVEEPIAFWETWTKRKYPQSGSYAMGGALVPLDIDVERGIGRYAEPNIWVTYDC